MIRSVTYLGDNRDRSNFGCRATSIALDDLLSTRFEIVERISGLDIERAVPSARLQRLQGRSSRRLNRRLAERDRGWRLNERLVGTGLSFDLFLASPRVAARRLLDERSSNPTVSELVRRVSECDALVINGEGDLILRTPPRRKLLFLLAMIELAHRVGTPVAYVNAMVSEPPELHPDPQVTAWARQALQPCRVVTLRDADSLQLTLDLGLHDSPHHVPDALFTWAHQEAVGESVLASAGATGFPFEGRPADGNEHPYVCVTGSSAYSRRQPAPISQYEAVVHALRARDVTPVLLEGSEADGFLRQVATTTGAYLVPWTCNIFDLAETVRRAELLIGGRFHPAVAAVGGGTALVPLGSNSHKMASLCRLVGLDVPEYSAQSFDATFDGALDRMLPQTAERRDGIRARAQVLGAKAQGLLELIAPVGS